MSEDPQRATGSRPPLRRLPRRWLAVTCGLLLAVDALDVVDVLYRKHGHYAAENWFGFYAAMGIAAGALALLAGRLGRLLKPRGETGDA